MKRILLLIAFTLVVLSGCSNSDESINFSGESENWKVTYLLKNLGDGVRESSGTIEYIGEESKPEEVTFQFFYKKDQESFGGSRTLNEDGSYAEFDSTTCTTCVMYAEDDEIPGVIEWDEQKESLVLTSN
ncbi:uncharacterized lipoprotein YehR (DUF1307 family) [Planomicrobium stackebrandtii]|uniref:Uncharacterized lipoprotein YehR (DUF1307 family) n=1 Tax=Planomicrobium stackebrandtii TaxID=253160 RepID=A0ABU0GVU2_9BACL|nr:lipoprotein [Planomicrobium stackebrandtii]MDQ0429462.1 uncharacterized lipoprotein YehR (DUF1307 family) [Planomicrobium stackebrandtii]